MPNAKVGLDWLACRGSNWHFIYIILAAFNILTIAGGFYLSHLIQDNYVRSVNIDQQWADRLARYADLEQVAASVNAPGNDVFDTRNVDTEMARQDQALAAFEQDLGAARADLVNVPEAQARPLLASLDAVAAAMRDMVAEADLIFGYFSSAERDLAAQRMANMDRKHAGVTAELARLGGQVRAIQKQQFQKQITAAQQLQTLQYLIGGLLVLMVGSVTLYGHKIVQKVQRDEQELERYSVSLAEARDAATAASRAKSDFLAVMSHEIRTPLTAVLGMADLLAADELPPKARDRALSICSSGRHLLAIVNNILDLSRIEAGGLRLEQIDFSVVEAVEQVRSLVALQAAERGLDLTVEHDARSLPVVRGDPTRVKQVLLNLVGNAVKFTPRGSVRVRVLCRHEGLDRSRVRFEVHDTGIGISLAKQAELFVAFSQVEGSITRVYGGTGLGLAISKRLVEAMGGEIGVESAPGKGSRFWFEIPLEAGDEQAVPERIPSVQALWSPLRVLIVEDVELNRIVLGEALARQGHEVIFAENGSQAVAAAARERFDAVVMDVHMPVMDGLEATRRIRALNPPACEVVIVGLTADVMQEERYRYLQAGMDCCLAKPPAWPELFAALAQAAARHGKAAASPPVADAPAAVPQLSDRLTVSLAADAGSPDLLYRVIDDAEQSCRRLGTLPAGSDELLQEMHKLKGTSGLFGLRRISATLAELQMAARDGLDLSHVNVAERLALAITATRAELQGAGMVATGPAGTDCMPQADEQRS
jgi:signal transduction histidine kinase/DNA-binding NarL/FixJ family response regulator/HPt (histidine-containing phosphotransfer) domain-containing protein